MYNRLPFEIHDKILSALCQTGTYKDIVAYGLTSQYHYALLEQNLDFKALKNTIRFVPTSVKRADKDNIVWSTFSWFIIPWSLDYIDGVYIENSCGRIIKAKFLGNNCLIEQLDNPGLSNGWIPFKFSKHHHYNACEFPVLPMTYVRFTVQITFDKPQPNTLTMSVHGKKVFKFGTEEYVKMFQPFDFFYPDTSQRIKVAGGEFQIDAVDQSKPL